nr:hypothetical protein [uncultured Acetatifactor sp.]
MTNTIPTYILEQCSNIKVIYQNKIWDKISGEESAFPKDITVHTCQEVLEKMYDFYNWGEEESTGKNAMVKHKNRLQYFAVLMFSWMQSTPLNMMIMHVIGYYKRKGHIWDKNKNEKLVFDAQSKYQINLIINDLISDIDNILRYKIKNYFQNYYLLVCEKAGKETAGENWAEYVEYGTTDRIIIELQNIGIPRHLSTIIKKDFLEYLTFEDGALVDIDIDNLIKHIDGDKYKEEFKELNAIFV